MMEDADARLLMRIDEQVQTLQRQREEILARLGNQERSLAAIELARALTRGQLLGMSAAVSTISATLIKLFW
jgi:hypothetical protein